MHRTQQAGLPAGADRVIDLVDTSAMPRDRRRSTPHVLAAQGATLLLADDARIIDLASGGFGHGAAPVVRAVTEQMRVNPLATRHFLSPLLALLTAELADVTPGELSVSYLCSSASEAVEGALKLARGFHPARHEFVAVLGSQHGSTLGALSVSGSEQQRALFPTLPLQTRFAADASRVADLVSEGTAAVVVEPCPGGTGLNDAAPGWLQGLSARCSRTGALLVVDESMTGCGRTGRMFAVDHERIVPDVLVLGGALGGGILPMAGYVTTRRVNDRVYGRRDPTLHASATGGNPAACAAALAVLAAVAEDDLVAHCAVLGDELLAGVGRIAAQRPALVAEVAGCGLLVRARLHRTTDAHALEQQAFEHGLLIHAHVEARTAYLELCPPLTVSADEIRIGLGRFEDAVTSISSRREVR